MTLMNYDFLFILSGEMGFTGLCKELAGPGKCRGNAAAATFAPLTG
jgi:hypothetical protein